MDLTIAVNTKQYYGTVIFDFLFVVPVSQTMLAYP